MATNHYFQLTKPCKNCPFRKDMSFLNKQRMKGIALNLLHEDGFFPCHCTIDFNEDDKILKEDNQFCAGALIFMEKQGRDNRPIRMGHIFGWYDPGQLSGQELICDTMDELIDKENER